jgi:hypothetical protein
MARPMASGMTASGTAASTLKRMAERRVPGMARSSDHSSRGTERAEELNQ